MGETRVFLATLRSPQMWFGTLLVFLAIFGLRWYYFPLFHVVANIILLVSGIWIIRLRSRNPAYLKILLGEGILLSIIAIINLIDVGILFSALTLFTFLLSGITFIILSIRTASA